MQCTNQSINSIVTTLVDYKFELLDLAKVLKFINNSTFVTNSWDYENTNSSDISTWEK